MALLSFKGYRLSTKEGTGNNLPKLGIFQQQRGLLQKTS